jgi:beta-lactamase regulating signal transducer with metallopeptidase domain
VLLAAWLAVAGIKLALLARGLRQLRKLKGSSTSASPGLEDLFQRLRSKLAVKRMVRLKVAPSHPSALVLGFIHPVIILPAEAVPEAGLGQAEHILRHELAHVRRRDDWTNLVQRFLEAALFFHPAVWWISKQLSLEREIACDDAVLHQGVRPQSYALLLANLASRMTGRLPSVAPGASSSKSQLQQRITMILNTHRNTSPRLAKARLGFITSAAALIAVLAVCSGPRLVLAQSQPPTPAPATAASGGVNVLPPADVDPGPKFKKGEAPEPPDAPAPAALPEAAVGPVAPVAPLPPGYAAAGSPPGPGADTFVSTPPPPPQGASIEERLARLERMVQKLLAQQGPKHLRSDAQAGPKAGMGVIEGRPVPKFLMDLQQLAPDQPLDLQLDPNLKGKDGKDWKFQFDNKDVELVQERVKREVARATEQAMREVARATEQAKRATDQAKRAFEQAQRAAKQAAEDFRREEQNENAKDHDLGQNSVDKQLAALQRQREALEREVQKLVGQIERLEEDRERAAEEPAPRGRNKAAAPKPDSTPSPAPAAK